MNGSKIVACIEARMGSSRLPGKVLMEIDGKPTLQILIERLEKLKLIDQIIIAATTNPLDEKIEELGEELGIFVYRGSEDDVLGRVVNAVEAVSGDIIVEITGDCTLMDPEVVESVIKKYLEGGYDYVTNIGYVDEQVREIPIGMDVRVFSYNDLKQISELTNDPEDREHVSLYFFRDGKNKYRLYNLPVPEKWKRDYKVRIALDTKEDFEFIKNVYTGLSKQKENFNLEDILNFLDDNKNLLEINSDVVQKTVTNLE
ncbi:MAG: glycosyltransferase family protein [bacterium]|nr:glycosyltransferase family protein [bacterium]